MGFRGGFVKGFAKDVERIFLTGFMGSGKTVVGRVLADRLGWNFLDTDELVERRSGMTIPELFDVGEETFRRWEHICLVEVAGSSRAVVALGGGALTREENWDAVRGKGPVVCLWAEPETILKRIRGDTHRPLLAGLDDEGKLRRIRELLEVRRPYYLRSDMVIRTDMRTPEEVAEEIIGLLRLRP